MAVLCILAVWGRHFPSCGWAGRRSSRCSVDKPMQVWRGLDRPGAQVTAMGVVGS